MAVSACVVQSREPPDLSPVTLVQEKTYQQRVAYVKHLFHEQEKIARVAYALSTSVLDLCRGKTTFTTGAYLFDWDQTDEAWLDVANDAIGINMHTPGIEVLIVIPGSPAEKAGLRVGDRILRMGEWYVPKGRGAFAKFKRRFNRKLRTGRREINFRIIRAGVFKTIRVEPIEACDYPILISDQDEPNAYTDGWRIVVYRGMTELARNDLELAIVISHELSHIILGHVDTKRQNALKGAVVGAVFDVLIAALIGVHTRVGEHVMANLAALAYSKEFEAEADYLGAYMLAYAGFDVTKIPDFQRSFGGAKGSTAAYSASHPTFDARVKLSKKTISEILEKIRRGEPLEPELARFQTRLKRDPIQ